jgi:hypothetical protein
MRNFRKALVAGAAALALTQFAGPAAAQDAAAVDPAVLAEMVGAAQAVLQSTQGPGGPGGGGQIAYALDGEERPDWSYWPRDREGLSLGRMNSRQRMLTQALLETLLSARGHLEVAAIMSL